MSSAPGGSQERSDLVAYWSVPLMDGTHIVEFEHGTTTGRRVVRVDGKEIIRREWMFNLVGEERFTVGKQQIDCELKVEPMPFFTFSYNLYVDNKPLQQFSEKQSQMNKMWTLLKNGKRYRFIFEKQSLNLWINGQYVETENCFTDAGTAMKFDFDNLIGSIKATTATKKDGVIHELYVDEELIEEECLA